MKLPWRRTRKAADDGFTLLETIVSIAMISVVTGSLTMFYTESHASTSLQAQTQVANQLASTAMEQVSLLPGTALVAGRPAGCVTSQWQSPAPGAGTYLAQMQEVADVSLGSLVCPTALGAVATLLASESLPTVQTATSRVNGVTLNFTQNFYVGLCWQAANAACTKPTGAVVPAAMLAMLRVVIAVTWTSARCPASLCSYVTDTLVTQNVTDLTFEFAS
jgi:prepilin-type N-terminal cleavage/methylation domain-containing protein